MRKYSQIRTCFTLALCGMLHGIELFKNLNLSLIYRGFPGVKNPPAVQETWFDPLVGKIPWRRKQQCPPLFLPGNPMDRGGCLAAVNGSQNSQTLLND